MSILFAFLFLFGQSPGPEPLDLDRLVQSVLERNREILAARRAWDASRARPSQESAPPNPVISIGSVNAGFLPLPGKSIGSEPQSYISPMVMQPLPFPGKLRLRGEIAQKEADSTRRMVEAVEFRVINELKEAYFELYQAERSLETIAKNRELLTQIRDIARARYEVGSGLQQDVLKADVEVTLLEERATIFRQRRESMKAKINQLLNQPPDTPLGDVGEIQSSPLDRTLDQLYAAAEESNPVVDSRRIMVDRSARRVDLARKQYLPDFNVQAGYMYMGVNPNLWNVQIGFEVPLYFWRKERKGVEEAAADLRGATNEYEAAAQDTYREVKDQHLAVTTSDRLMKLYQDAVIPQAALALESSLSSYRVGRLDFFTILNNWTIVLNFELEYYNQLAMRETALANLERLTGLRLVRSGGIQ